MRTKAAAILLGLLAAIIISVAVPYLEVTLACRRPSSEQCVWGKALIGVNMVGTFVVLGLPMFTLIVWRLRRGHKVSNWPRSKFHSGH